MNELEGCADLDPDHCPFCGSDEVDPDGWKDGQGRTGPSCDNCGATAESVEEWNHRPAEDRLREEVEGLRGILDGVQDYINHYLHPQQNEYVPNGRSFAQNLERYLQRVYFAAGRE